MSMLVSQQETKPSGPAVTHAAAATLPEMLNADCWGDIKCGTAISSIIAAVSGWAR
jgi:hypothetical protein